MSDNQDNLDQLFPAEDDFGPGADLLMALFVITLLGLAVIGVGSGVFEDGDGGEITPGLSPCETGDVSDGNCVLTEGRWVVYAEDQVPDPLPDPCIDGVISEACVVTTLPRQLAEFPLSVPPPASAITSGEFFFQDSFSVTQSMLNGRPFEVDMAAFQRAVRQINGRLSGAEQPIKLVIVVWPSTVMLGGVDPSLSNAQAVTEVSGAAATLGATYAQIAFEQGMPMLCVEVRTPGLGDAPALSGVGDRSRGSTIGTFPEEEIQIQRDSYSGLQEFMAEGRPIAVALRVETSPHAQCRMQSIMNSL